MSATFVPFAHIGHVSRQPRALCITPRRVARMSLRDNNGSGDNERRTQSVLRTPEAIVAVALVAFALLRELFRGDGPGIAARLRARVNNVLESRSRVSTLDTAATQLRTLADSARIQGDRALNAEQDAKSHIQRAQIATDALQQAQHASAMLDAIRAAAAGEQVPPLKDTGVLGALLNDAITARTGFDIYATELTKLRKQLEHIDTRHDADDLRELADAHIVETKALIQGTKAAISTRKSADQEIVALKSQLSHANDTVEKAIQSAKERQKRVDELRVELDKLSQQTVSHDTPVSPIAASAAESAAQTAASARALRRLRREVDAARTVAASIMAQARGVAAGKVEFVDASRELKAVEKAAQISVKKDSARQRRRRAAAVKDVKMTSVREATRGNNSDERENRKKKSEQRGKRDVAADEARVDADTDVTAKPRSRKKRSMSTKNQDASGTSKMAGKSRRRRGKLGIEMNQSYDDEIETALRKVEIDMENLFESSSIDHVALESDTQVDAAVPIEKSATSSGNVDIVATLIAHEGKPAPSLDAINAVTSDASTVSGGQTAEAVEGVMDEIETTSEDTGALGATYNKTPSSDTAIEAIRDDDNETVVSENVTQRSPITQKAFNVPASDKELLEYAPDLLQRRQQAAQLNKVDAELRSDFLREANAISTADVLTPTNRRHGRPRKTPLAAASDTPKRKRGRPRKKPLPTDTDKPKRKRGRPRKHPLPPEQTET